MWKAVIVILLSISCNVPSTTSNLDDQDQGASPSVSFSIKYKAWVGSRTTHIASNHSNHSGHHHRRH